MDNYYYIILSLVLFSLILCKSRVKKIILSKKRSFNDFISRKKLQRIFYRKEEKEFEHWLTLRAYYKALKSEELEQRLIAVRELQNIIHPESTRRLKMLLSNEKDAVCRTAIMAALSYKNVSG